MIREPQNLIADLQPDTSTHCAIDHRVIAVLRRRHEGWCIYIGAVPGLRHDEEWQEVKKYGSKVGETTARAMAREYFGLEPANLPYAR